MDDVQAKVPCNRSVGQHDGATTVRRRTVTIRTALHQQDGVISHLNSASLRLKIASLSVQDFWFSSAVIGVANGQRWPYRTFDPTEYIFTGLSENAVARTGSVLRGQLGQCQYSMHRVFVTENLSLAGYLQRHSMVEMPLATVFK